MIGVNIGSIIFNCLLGDDIFCVEFTRKIGYGTLVLHSSSALWSTIIHGTLVYGFTSSIEDNTFIKGMECKVAREVVGRWGEEGP